MRHGFRFWLLPSAVVGLFCVTSFSLALGLNPFLWAWERALELAPAIGGR